MKNYTWYYNKDLKPQGPISTPAMRELIVKGEVGPRDLVCCHEDGRWLMAQDWAVFEPTLYPASQEFIPGLEVDASLKEWVMLVQDEEKKYLQEGPFSRDEVLAGLKQNRIHSEQFIWKSGLSGWSRIADRPEFEEAL